MKVSFEFRKEEVEEYFLRDFLKTFLLNQKYYVIEVEFTLRANIVKIESMVEEAHKEINIKTTRDFIGASRDKVLRMLGVEPEQTLKKFIKPTEEDIDYLLEEFIYMKNRKTRLLNSINDDFFDLIEIEINYLIK